MFQYGSMAASDLKQITELKDGNHRLKQMFAGVRLESWALKDVIEKSFKTSL